MVAVLRCWDGLCSPCSTSVVLSWYSTVSVSFTAFFCCACGVVALRRAMPNKRRRKPTTKENATIISTTKAIKMRMILLIGIPEIRETTRIFFDDDYTGGQFEKRNRVCVEPFLQDYCGVVANVARLQGIKKARLLSGLENIPAYKNLFACVDGFV